MFDAIHQLERTKWLLLSVFQQAFWQKLSWSLSSHRKMLFLKGRIHWNFSFRAFHEIQFQGHFMKHEILSWNTFTLVSNIHSVCFSSIKRYRVKFNSIKKYLLLIKQKQKNSRTPKRIWMKPCSKTRSNIFLELSLTI